MREYNTLVAWDQNDTSNYYWYYNCLRESDLLSCNAGIGLNFFEIILPILAYISDIFTGQHYFMFFAVSMLFFASLIFFYSQLGGYSILVIPLVFLTPNFWELELNIIRNSLACSFLFLALTFERKKNTFFILGGISHTMGTLYFFAVKLTEKCNPRYLICLFLFLLIIPFSLTDALISIVQNIPYLNTTTVPLKLLKYSDMESGGGRLLAVIGKVYTFIIILLYFIVKDDRYALTLYKLLLIILIIGCFLQDTAIVYRIINIYTFIIFYLVVSGIRNKSLFSIFLYALCFLWSVYIFNLEGDFFLRFLR
ncbi:MAG: EpsG family protein [Psychrobacter sp.]